MSRPGSRGTSPYSCCPSSPPSSRAGGARRSRRLLTRHCSRSRPCCNVYPCAPDAATEMLAAVHLPVALWIVVGIAYMDGANGARSPHGLHPVHRRVVRLLRAARARRRRAHRPDPGMFKPTASTSSGSPSGCFRRVRRRGGDRRLARRSEAERHREHRTGADRVFTPLFTLLLSAVIVAGIVPGNPVDRDLLIIFDVILLVVLALLLYSLSARSRGGAGSMTLHC